MAGLSLSQRETADLLDTILSVVEQRRHDHGQKSEVAKRQLNDATSAPARSSAGNAMDFHRALEQRYRALRGDIEDVITDVCGKDWREALKS